MAQREKETIIVPTATGLHVRVNPDQVVEANGGTILVQFNTAGYEPTLKQRQRWANIAEEVLTTGKPILRNSS